MSEEIDQLSEARLALMEEMIKKEFERIYESRLDAEFAARQLVYFPKTDLMNYDHILHLVNTHQLKMPVNKWTEERFAAAVYCVLRGKRYHVANLDRRFTYYQAIADDFRADVS